MAGRSGADPVCRRPPPRRGRPLRRRALILALGEYPAAGLPSRRFACRGPGPLLPGRGRPGLHSAIDWVLRVRWGGKPRGWNRSEQAPAADRDWYVNRQGQSLALLRAPIEGMIRSPRPSSPAPPGGPARAPDRSTLRNRHARGHRARVRPFPRNAELALLTPTGTCPDRPMLGVNFFDALRFCNWLSAREGIPESQWCYPKEVSRGMTLPADFLRGPATACPPRSNGRSPAGRGRHRPLLRRVRAMARHYAWNRFNSGSFPHPVGQLKPNDLGLFDTLGNAWEWTMDTGAGDSIAPARPDPWTMEVNTEVPDDATRILRGGTFDYGPEMSRCAAKPGLTPSSRYYTLGLRVAWTLPSPARKPR